jgi:iron complex outermembrane receptor protein
LVRCTRHGRTSTTAVRVSVIAILASIALTARAQTTGGAGSTQPPTTSLEKVIVTGSHIPRSEAETALPVQVITREEIDRSGVTTVEQLLERIAGNFNGFNAAQTIGNGTSPGLSSANLRGLGHGSTLVLLNGRRLANYAFDGETVDLNSIPLAAIDRVEVLKDGASALYGTDAIAGVINFILRKDYTGAEVSGELAVTQHGGGNSGLVSAAYGFGDPARDGYNVFGVVSLQKQQALHGSERDSTKTSHRPDLGVSGLSPTTFPANIFDRPGRRVLNPIRADGCAPPSSLPFDSFGTPACGFDFAAVAEVLPEVERTSALLRGTWRVNPDIDLFAEALVGRNRFESRVAPNPIQPISSFGPLLYPAGGVYYPTEFAAASGLTGDLLISYRATELGSRTNATTTDAQRYVLGAEGQLANWDFNIAAVYSANHQENEYGGSWVYTSRIIPAMRTGLINPWGPSGPEGRALLASTAYSGTPQTADASTSIVSAVASRELANLPAGPLALALGAEQRWERLSYDWDPAVLTGDSPIGDMLQAISGDRDVLALFAELNIPIVRGLEAQVAVRYDDYSDFGSTTNPKVALRWQPLRSLLLRGSWGEGFRAPPLYSLSAPTTSVGIAGPIEDPLRCPATGTFDDCLAFVENFSGGNPDLQPETSKQWNIGIVWEPVSGVSFGVDYWNIEQTGVIEPLFIENVLRYYDRFSFRVIRGPVDPATPNLPGPIVAVDSSLINLGTTQTSGIDVSFNWKLPPSEHGTFGIGLFGTYVRQWDTQIDGVTYVSLLGDATYGAPVPRWRSTVTFDWTLGPWGATLAQIYTSGYVEQLSEPAVGTREVDSSSSWDLQGRYAGFRGWQLAAGIRNLFDEEPPFSQTSNFQFGFNPQAASPLGRQFYLRATYAWK